MTSADALIRAWAPAAAPPPALTVSEWADAERRLPESSGARGGRWRTDRTPYLRGIMDAVHEHGVRKIALMKCAQVGGSEAINNILGYFIEHDPCPMLLVQPTASVAEEWSKERLADMIRTTPALRRVVQDKRQPRDSHLAESTLSLKIFPGGYLALGGANTPNTFARRSVAKAFGDDCDRWPPVVGEEGDPSDLLVKRTETFHDALVMMVSTPTLKGGRIDTLYDRSDRRRYVVQCPSCGRRDWMTWSDPAHFRVVFDERDPTSARLECPAVSLGGCGTAIDEPTRRKMVAAGAWEATAKPQEVGLVGFHLPAMVTTLGNASLERWVEEWLAAHDRGKESTRVFINTTLAEGWEDRTGRIQSNTLMQRREAYGPDGIEVPAEAPVLTAGVDVQENRFELQVTAWGAVGERWVVDWRSIPGDPKQPETRASLWQALQRKYVHASGAMIPIHATCVDTGWATDEMYDFVLAYQAHRVFATKGFAGRTGDPIIGKPSDKRSGKSARPVQLYPVNVDDAKADVMAAIARGAEVGKHGPGPVPGAMHFPILDSIGDEYFAQLCAEHRETRYNKAGVATHTVWVLDRERNEALDTAVLCLAAFRRINPNIRQMLEALGKEPPPPAAPPTPSTYWQRRPGGFLKGGR